MCIATGRFLKQERRSLVMRCEESPWGRRVCEAKHSAFPETTNYRYDISTQPIWHKGPVVLVGDAIHAVSPGAGQGASLAVEDAIVLAKCLRDREDHPLAFATYEHLRRERVEHMVKYGRSLGQAKIMTNPIQVWFRDMLMPFFFKHFANPAALDWVYSYKVDWDEHMALEERLEMPDALPSSFSQL